MDADVNPYRYYAPALPRRILAPDDQVQSHILRLWDYKRDTYDIAIMMGIPEPQIESLLHRALQARR